MWNQWAVHGYSTRHWSCQRVHIVSFSCLHLGRDGCKAELSRTCRPAHLQEALQDNGRRMTMSVWQFRVPEQVGQYTKQKPLNLSSLSFGSPTVTYDYTFQGSDQCIHTQGQGTRPHLSMNCRCVLKLLQSSLCLQMLTCFLHEKYTPSRDRPLWHQAQAAQAIGPGFHHHQIMSLSSVCDRQLNDDLNLGSVSSAECRELICKLKWEFYFGWGGGGGNGRDGKKHLQGMLQFTSNNISNVTNNKTQGAKVSQGPCSKWGT